MRRRRPTLRWLLVLALATGCGADRSAEETVRLYFATLGRDPIRSSALTSASFQATHGLRFGTRADVAQAERQAVGARRAPTAPATVDGSAADSRSEAEVIWLATQMKPGFQERAQGLVVAIEEVRPGAHGVEVTARVAPAAAPAFHQRFWLSRDGSGRFRIDRIEQEDVEPASYADAFVAAPSESSRRRLADAIGAPTG